jgi:formyl-CoA transferase
MDDVDALVSNWTRTRTKTEVFETLLRHKVPSAPVRELGEVVEDVNMHQRGMLQWINHPEYGRMVLPSTPLRFDGLEPLPLRPSPGLDADEHAVLRDWFGLSNAEVDTLRAAGAIGAKVTATGPNGADVTHRSGLIEG